MQKSSKLCTYTTIEILFRKEKENKFSLKETSLVRKRFEAKFIAPIC